MNMQSLVNGLGRRNTPSDDAALIAACAAFDECQRRYQVADAAGGDDITLEAEARTRGAVIAQEQEPHYHAILDTPCATLAGARAVAASVTLWGADLLEGPFVDKSLALQAKIVTSLLAMQAGDVELIAACNEFLRIQRAFEAYAETLIGDWEDDDPMQAMLDPVPELVEQIVALHATTAEGHLARARCHAFTFLPTNDVCVDDPDGSQYDRFHAAAMRDLTRMERGGATRCLPHSDAELLALRPEYERLKVAYDAVDNTDNLTDDEVADCGEEFDAFCIRVVAMPPARTAEGRAFKAQAVLAQHVYVDGRGDADDAIRTVLQELIDAAPVRAAPNAQMAA